MAHSLKTLKANFAKYYSLVYNYMLRFVYYGSVPTIILYGNILIVFNEGIGLFAKPYSPIVMAMMGYLTGQQPAQEDLYGG